eukprot:4167138-Amphidinium_carterae.1
MEKMLESSEALQKSLQWQSADTSRATEYDNVAAYSLPAPKEAGRSEDEPCGLNDKDSQSGDAFRRQMSKARPLSSSGCVWLLQDVCLEERRILFFSDKRRSPALPRKLLGCGEFGQWDFNAVQRRPLSTRADVLNGTEVVDTALVLPGFANGDVSIRNPFHILHSTIPAAWQLHHPSYGLCVSRDDIDIYFACTDDFVGRRLAHFWKAFTRDHEWTETLMQQFDWASTLRFWWGPFSSSPPQPLGSQRRTKCYRNVIFGRELMRTGIAGFVTPRVVSFYHRYLSTTLARAEVKRRSHEEGPGDSEERLFAQMQSRGDDRSDRMAL